MSKSSERPTISLPVDPSYSDFGITAEFLDLFRGHETISGPPSRRFQRQERLRRQDARRNARQEETHSEKN